MDGSDLHMTLPFNVSSSSATLKAANAGALRLNALDFAFFPWTDEPPMYEVHDIMSTPSWEEYSQHVFVPARSVRDVGVWTHRDPPSFDEVVVKELRANIVAQKTSRPISWFFTHGK